MQVYPRALSAAEVSPLYGRAGGGDVTTGKLVTTWTRDQRGLPTSMTDPDGDGHGLLLRPGRAAGAHHRTDGHHRDLQRNPRSPPTRSPGPGTTRSAMSARPRTPTATSPPTGTTPTAGRCPRRCRRTPRPGGPPVTAVETTGYDGDGNVTSASDGIGNTTKYAYDQLGDQVTATAPDNSVTTTAYDADRQPLSVTGPTGAQTQTTWDYLGRKATSTQIERDSGAGTAAYTTTTPMTTAAPAAGSCPRSPARTG